MRSFMFYFLGISLLGCSTLSPRNSASTDSSSPDDCLGSRRPAALNKCSELFIKGANLSPIQFSIDPQFKGHISNTVYENGKFVIVDISEMPPNLAEHFNMPIVEVSSKTGPVKVSAVRVLADNQSDIYVTAYFKVGRSTVSKTIKFPKGMVYNIFDPAMKQQLSDRSLQLKSRSDNLLSALEKESKIEFSKTNQSLDIESGKYIVLDTSLLPKDLVEDASMPIIDSPYDYNYEKSNSGDKKLTAVRVVTTNDTSVTVRVNTSAGATEVQVSKGWIMKDFEESIRQQLMRRSLRLSAQGRSSG